MKARYGWIAAIVLFLVSVVTPAFGGSYLDRATLLLDGSERDLAMIGAHMTDKELATMVEVIADARLKAASKMVIPTSIAKAHPHLLLVLEHTERAADAAKDGNFTTAREHLDDAEREDRMFRAQMSELGFPLPASS